MVTFFLISTDLQMVFVALPRAFQAILENLQNFEINTLGAKGTIIIIWGTFNFYHNLVYFLKWLTNGPCIDSYSFQSNFKKSPKKWK